MGIFRQIMDLNSGKLGFQKMEKIFSFSRGIDQVRLEDGFH